MGDLGMYGELHRQQILEIQPELAKKLRRGGDWESHLPSVDRRALEMFERIKRRQMDRRPDLSEGQAERIADEVVMKEGRGSSRCPEEESGYLD